jgi:hypothetical protein
MFEHKVLQAPSLANEANLDKLSAEGWELISIVKESGKFYYYFKRRVSGAIFNDGAILHKC